MSYVGPERRIHKMYVTRNTEYHVRRDRCVGVRDRSSEQWKGRHSALGTRLVGAVPSSGAVPVVARQPEPGDRLCFGDMLVVTSPLQEVRRPPKDIVRAYPVDRTA